MRTSGVGARLPVPEQAPALSMPAHDRVGRNEGEVATPAGADAASHDPQQLVPGTHTNMWSGASRTGQDGELMAQQQVLKYEMLARTNPGQDCREQQPDDFQHALSIADLWRAR